MTPLENLLARLPNAKKVGNGWSARCPAHDDRRASLSIAQGDDGAALVKCHAGCNTSAILAAIGLKLADLFPPKAGATPTRNGKPTPNGRKFATAREAVAVLERKHGKRSADADDLAYRPFPVNALPQPIRGFVDAGARAIGCDPSYLALPLLTASAAAIGNTRRLELKRGWSAPPILWGAIVGESGTAKTPAFKLVIKPVRERQSRAFKVFEAQQQEYEAALEAWQEAKKGERGEKPQPPSCERLIVSDTTVEALAPILLANPRGLLLARDELAGWIGSFDRYASRGRWAWIPRAG